MFCKTERRLNMKKQIFVMALASVMSFLLVGCGNSQKDTSEKDNSKTETTNVTSEDSGKVIADSTDSLAAIEQDTDDDNDMNTKNMVSVEELEKGKYKVTNEGRAVVVAYNDGDCLSTTSYNYKDGVLDSISMISKYKDAATAKKAYDTLSADKSMKENYSKLELEDDKIKGTVAQSEVDSLKSFTQKELYEQQSELYAELSQDSKDKD